MNDSLPQPAGFRDPDPFALAVAGQSLRFYPAGEDRRAAMLEMVRGARVSLKLVFYIFAEDAISTRLRDELAAAAGRGVRVMLIIDRFGSSASAGFLAPLTRAGGTVRYSGARWTQRYLIRNHQKMIIADDAAALFGGFNIQDDYFAPPAENGWTDLAIRIEGSAVAGLVDLFARLERWTEPGARPFREIRRTARRWEWADGEVRWLIGGPARGLSSWARCVSHDLARARRLDMFMAYFSPPQSLLRRIGAIARRGEARLLMAGKSDNNVTLGATRSLYSYLLRKGARIWEFSPCKLHTKLIVLDDTVYLGSANFDMRSLYLNLEVVLRVRDAGFAERMRAYISHHIAAAEAITPALHARRAGAWNRFRWNLAWLLVSVVDYTVTRRLNLGL